MDAIFPVSVRSPFFSFYGEADQERIRQRKLLYSFEWYENFPVNVCVRDTFYLQPPPPRRSRGTRNLEVKGELSTLNSSSSDGSSLLLALIQVSILRSFGYSFFSARLFLLWRRLKASGCLSNCRSFSFRWSWSSPSGHFPFLP